MVIVVILEKNRSPLPPWSSNPSSALLGAQKNPCGCTGTGGLCGWLRWEHDMSVFEMWMVGILPTNMDDLELWMWGRWLFYVVGLGVSEWSVCRKTVVFRISMIERERESPQNLCPNTQIASFPSCFNSLMDCTTSKEKKDSSVFQPEICQTFVWCLRGLTCVMCSLNPIFPPHFEVQIKHTTVIDWVRFKVGTLKTWQCRKRDAVQLFSSCLKLLLRFVGPPQEQYCLTN